MMASKDVKTNTQGPVLATPRPSVIIIKMILVLVSLMLMMVLVLMMLVRMMMIHQKLQQMAPTERCHVEMSQIDLDL